LEAAGAERFAALRKSISFALRGVLNSFGSGSVKAIPETSKFLNSDARVLQFFDQIDAKLGRIPILPLHFDWATVASLIRRLFSNGSGRLSHAFSTGFGQMAEVYRLRIQLLIDHGRGLCYRL